MEQKEGTVEWVSGSKQANALLFSELDVLLRALDRFFVSENHASSGEDLTVRNFYEELITVRDAILRVLGILEVIIPESRKNAYWFQKFAETKLLSTRKRDSFRESLYSQDTPEKGLYLLYDSFINLKGVITDLLRSGSISYMGFLNIGGIISKEIRENKYFNPFSRELNPEYDFIGNSEISDIVKGLQPRDLKKCISIIYIQFFRFTRFLSFIDIAAQRSVSLNSSLLILLLLKTEIAEFLGYVEKAVKKVKDPGLEMFLKAMTFQLSMESRRVYQQELRDIHRRKASPQYRGKIENSHGIMKNLTEQCIVQLTLFFRPEIKGEELFSSFVTRMQQSLRLREDVFVLHKLLAVLEAKAADPRERLKVFESIRNYMLYFESFTFRLLRYDDYEEFVKFFNEMHSVKKEQAPAQGFDKVLERVQHFKIYLETTLRHIANRSELNGKAVDTERVEALVKQYL